jgi:hypothetical protein
MVVTLTCRIGCMHQIIAHPLCTWARMRLIQLLEVMINRSNINYHCLVGSYFEKFQVRVCLKTSR